MSVCFMQLRIGNNGGILKRGSKTSGSEKDREFLDLLSLLLASQEVSCSMKLLNEIVCEKEGPISPAEDCVA